ncbi:MAG: penicillin acylase family protein [Acidobacteriota bacterium]|nr:penicillin acylase family protein [Acidobacteriota bacterium]
MEILSNVIRWPLVIAIALTLISDSTYLSRPRDSRRDDTNITHVAGTHGRVEIGRDRDGVPHVRAKSESDAHFGLGYAHAQDRLWQMEYQRRLANGQLAEILGEPGIVTDRLFRTVGLHRAAAGAWANLSPHERLPIEAYVAGINAYLDNPHDAQLPAEFKILGVEPEPWRAEDVLAWSKALSWGISGNWDKELLRAQLTQKFGPEKTAQLMPAYTADGPVILRNKSQQSSANRKPSADRSRSSVLGTQHSVLSTDPSSLGLLALHRAVAERTGLGAEGYGTNSWVLSGERTTTGKPILANDPHQPGQTPSLWYLARVTGGGLDVIGATIPGGPGVQVGHNGHVAWGISTINVDSQDVYMERINERNEAEYEDAWEPLRIVPETIKVKDKPDLYLKVRISRHGPLISDVINPAGQALALRWTGNDPEDTGTLAALAFNRARDWHEFAAAFRDHRAADQNYVYADQKGNIGYIAAGTIPRRAKGDGRLPAPGWTGEFEWTGYVPFDELPRAYNPPQGYIATANNRVAGDDYPHLIGTNFAAPYRAARVVEMIESGRKHSPADTERMQADVVALHAREILPLLLKATPADERGKRAIEMLRGWDARMKGEDARAAVFAAWYTEIGKRLFKDELGPELWRTYSRNIYMVGMALPAALKENTTWCDDARTYAIETCADTLSASLSEGLTRMSAAQGTDDINAWRWDKAHHALFPHNPFDRDERLKQIFSRSIPNGGDKFTVNVASSFRNWEEYNQDHTAAYRQIVDFKRINRSRFINAPGQSGDPESRHYDDLLRRWQRVEYLPMRFGHKAFDAAPDERLMSDGDVSDHGKGESR